ncbi:hypothetical protein DIPPA_17701 [Diplonema papillatum]|nr:hypothetical protein DIPPA_17701 [Diplonema papillatum]
MSIDVLSQCEQADRGVTWCKGEVERADEQEVAALEERLRWLECRAAGRREEQKKKAVERERNQALFRVQLAIDLKEERHWGREQDRLQELDDMSYLFRKQDEDAFAAALPPKTRKRSLAETQEPV